MTAPPDFGASPHCQYCGEAMAERIVVCSRCSTPHHRECFVENGACTTYACGSSSFRDGITNETTELPRLAEGIIPWERIVLPPDVVRDPKEPGRFAYENLWQRRGVFALFTLPFVATLVAFLNPPPLPPFLGLALFGVLVILCLLVTLQLPPVAIVVDGSRRTMVLSRLIGFFRTRRSLPFEDCMGLMLRESVEGRTTEYRLELILRSRAIVLLLGSSSRAAAERTLRPWAHALAKVLNRPLMDCLDGVDVLRHPHELGLPLRQLRRARQSQAAGPPRSPVAGPLPPSNERAHPLRALSDRPGLTHRLEAEGFSLELGAAPVQALSTLWAATRFFVAISALLCLVILRTRGLPGLKLHWDGAALFAFVLTTILVPLELWMRSTRRERITVTPSEIVVELSDGQTTRSSIDVDRILALETSRKGGGGDGSALEGPCLVIVTPEGPQGLGRGMTAEELAWLRGRIEALLEKNPGGEMASMAAVEGPLASPRRNSTGRRKDR